MSSLKTWLICARPKTLPAAVGPVLIGAAMASTRGDIDPAVFALTMATAILLQVATNFANDYYDFIKGADTQHRTGPVRGTQAGLVSPAGMRKAFILTFGLVLVLGFFLVVRGRTPILAIGVASVACGLLYTAGPFPIGYLGLGELFVLFFFGPVAVGGTYYLQRLDISADVIVAGLAPGLLACAILAVNNLRDIHTDKAAGKMTLAVRFGYGFGVAEYVFCVAAACLVPAFLCLFLGSKYSVLVAVLTGVTAWWPIKTVCSKPSPGALNAVLAQTGGLSIVFSVLFSAGWVI